MSRGRQPGQRDRLGRTLVLTHPARLGDGVLSLPLHRALSGIGEVASNVGDPYRFLFEQSGIQVSQAGPLYPKGAIGLVQVAKQLRNQAFQTVFLVRPNFRAALLARMAGIPVRVGDPTEGRGLLLTHRVSVRPTANQLERLEAFGEIVGLNVLREFGLPVQPKAAPPLIGIVPAGSYEDKNIPMSALVPIAQRLKHEGYRIALLGTAHERAWATDLLSFADEDWMGAYSLAELTGPLSSLSALLAPDGGLYHLAVGVGVPSVGVYGPTAHRFWWHSWGPHEAVLAEDGNMKRITAEQLWPTLERVLGSRSDHVRA